jgi:flagellar FliJ protein
MKKFSFELEKVLEYRNFEKQQAEGELAKALAVETEIENNLKTIAQQYAAVKAQMKGSLNFQDVMAQSQFNNLLEYQKEELLKQLTQAKIVTDEKREVLRECMKNTTALEKLKEKQLADWKQAVDYEESELLDEVKNQLTSS